MGKGGGMFGRPALLGAPVLAVGLFVLLAGAGLTPAGRAVACVSLLMAIWWMTEAIPLAVTALLPLVLFPALKVAPIDTAARAYAHPLIFLFLGGFLLAQAMQRWRLNERVAFYILRLTSTHPAGIVAGVMAATAFLSMWVSNTATAMMMLPIGQSIIQGVQRRPGGAPPLEVAEFSSALMLGIAYAATIGGMGTLIGTPPNALFAGFMSEAYGIEISFARWMLVGVPAVVILLPIAWLVLTQAAFKLRMRFPGEAASLGAFANMEAMPTGARRTAVILILAALGWVSHPLLQSIVPDLAPGDAGIAIAAAIALFIVPSGGAGSEPLLTWDGAKTIRWDVLILFGGGLSLADAISTSGLAAWIGTKAAGLGALPPLAVVLAVTALIVALGELASNTAVAAIFLPIAGATAVGLGVAPVELAMPVALAASLGFMLPVATPPNAIVYGSGAVSVQQMLRAGFLLDVIGVVIVTLIAMSIGTWVFGAL